MNELLFYQKYKEGEVLMDLDQAIQNGTLGKVMKITSEVLNEPFVSAGTILPSNLKCCVCSKLVKETGLVVDCKINNCFRIDQTEEEIFVASLVKNNIIFPKSSS